MRALTSIALICLLASANGNDPYCGCELDHKFGMPNGWEASKIWLDLVIILDTSEVMGVQGLAEAITTVQSIIGVSPGDPLQTNTAAEFYTRIGLIAMSDTPQTLYNLNMTANDPINVKITEGLVAIDVNAAFKAAEQMLIDGQTNNPARKNARRVIYYMTNSDAQILDPTINQFKKNNGIIIVNQFVQNGAERPALKKLASDGYYSTDFQYNYWASMQLFCKANCYCLADKKSYAGTNQDPAVKASGGCYNFMSAGTGYSHARQSCANGGGLIASIHDQNKAQFVNGVIDTKPWYYWIGYSKMDTGVWTWQDQSNDPFVNWGMDEPSTASIAECAYVDSYLENLPWGAANCNVGFPVVCEYAPCSAGNKNC